jgi:hypothetical protein
MYVWVVVGAVGGCSGVWTADPKQLQGEGGAQGGTGKGLWAGTLRGVLGVAEVSGRSNSSSEGGGGRGDRQPTFHPWAVVACQLCLWVGG